MGNLFSCSAFFFHSSADLRGEKDWMSGLDGQTTKGRGTWAGIKTLGSA